MPLNKFRHRTQRGLPYIVARCRQCEQEYNSLHHDKERKKQRERERYLDPEKRKKRLEYKRRWVNERPGYYKKRYHNDIEKQRERDKKYRQNNIDNVRKGQRERARKRRNEISDLYVKGVVSKQIGIAFREIPPSFIKLKKIQIKAKRILKTIKK